MFVGDRKMDEELGGTTRFVGDIDHMTKVRELYACYHNRYLD